MEIDSVNTTAEELALFFIVFAIMSIGSLIVMPDGPSEILAADDPPGREGE